MNDELMNRFKLARAAMLEAEAERAAAGKEYHAVLTRFYAAERSFKAVRDEFEAAIAGQ
jgi:hypothetical protein